MASRESLFKALELLEEAWPSEKASRAFGDDVYEHIRRSHIDDDDVVSAAYKLRRAKVGKQGFPSIDKFCDAVDEARSMRKARDAQNAPTGTAAYAELLGSSIEGNCYVTRLYGRALMLKMGEGLTDDAAISKAVDFLALKGVIDDGSLLPKLGNPSTSLQLAINRRSLSTDPVENDYDPFAEDE